MVHAFLVLHLKYVIEVIKEALLVKKLQILHILHKTCIRVGCAFERNVKCD